MDTGIDRPDFSYLEDQGPVDPTVYDTDAYIGEPGPNVIPLLTEEDGMQLGLDGKLHFVGEAAASTAGLHDPTYGAERVPVHDVTPGLLAVRGLSTARAAGGRVYHGSGHPYRPHASHRAQ